MGKKSANKQAAATPKVRTIFTNDQLDAAIAAFEITLHTSGTDEQNKVSDENNRWLAGTTKGGYLLKPNYKRTSQTKKAIEAGRKPGGALFKKGPVYIRFYFLLTDATQKLEFYEDDTLKNKRGELDLRTIKGLCLSEVADAPAFSVDLYDVKQHYTLAADEEREILMWAFALRRCLASCDKAEPNERVSGGDLIDSGSINELSETLPLSSVTGEQSGFAGDPTSVEEAESSAFADVMTPMPGPRITQEALKTGDSNIERVVSPRSHTPDAAYATFKDVYTPVHASLPSSVVSATELDSVATPQSDSSTPSMFKEVRTPAPAVLHSPMSPLLGTPPVLSSGNSVRSPLAADDADDAPVEVDDDDDREFMSPPAAEDADPWREVPGAVLTPQLLPTPVRVMPVGRSPVGRDEDEELVRLSAASGSSLRDSGAQWLPINSSPNSGAGKSPRAGALESGYLARTTTIDTILNYPSVAAPVRYTEGDSSMLDTSSFNAPVPMWELADERTTDLGTSRQALLSCMPLKRVTGVTSVNNMLILQGRSVSTIVTGTLRHVEIKSQLLVRDNSVLHTTRGAYAVGYLRKWPSATQSIGRQTKRFFILKDSLLRYYRSEPSSIDACKNDYMYRLHISAFSTVRRHTKYLLNCIRIHRNEDPDDILWVRVSPNDLSATTSMLSGLPLSNVASSSSGSPVSDVSAGGASASNGSGTAAELTTKEENKWIREIGNAILNCGNNGFNKLCKPFVGAFPAVGGRASPVKVPKVPKVNRASDNGKDGVAKWAWDDVQGVQRDCNGEPISTTTSSPVLTKTRIERRWYQDSNLYVSSLMTDAISLPLSYAGDSSRSSAAHDERDLAHERMMLHCALFSYTRELHPLTLKPLNNGDFFVSLGAHLELAGSAGWRQEEACRAADVHFDLVGDMGRPPHISWGLGSYLRVCRLCYNNNSVLSAASLSGQRCAPYTELLLGGTGGRVAVALLDTAGFSSQIQQQVVAATQDVPASVNRPMPKQRHQLRVVRCFDLKEIDASLSDDMRSSRSAEGPALLGHSRFSTVTAVAAAPGNGNGSGSPDRRGYIPVAVVTGDDLGNLVFWRRRQGFQYGRADDLGGPLEPMMQVNLVAAVGTEGGAHLERHEHDAEDTTPRRSNSSNDSASYSEPVLSIDFLSIDTSPNNPFYTQSSANSSHGEKRPRVPPLDPDSQFITVSTPRRVLIVAIRPPKTVPAAESALPPTTPSESQVGGAAYTLRWVELDRVPAWGTRAVFSLAPVVAAPSYSSNASSGNLAGMLGSSYGSPTKEASLIRNSAGTSAGTGTPHTPSLNAFLRVEGSGGGLKKTSLLTNSLARPIFTFILWKVVEEDGRENLVPIANGPHGDAHGILHGEHSAASASEPAAEPRVGTALGAAKLKASMLSIVVPPVTAVAGSVSNGTTPRDSSIRNIDRLEGLGSPTPSVAVGSLTMSHSFLSRSKNFSFPAVTLGDAVDASQPPALGSDLDGALTSRAAADEGAENDDHDEDEGDDMFHLDTGNELGSPTDTGLASPPPSVAGGRSRRGSGGRFAKLESPRLARSSSIGKTAPLGNMDALSSTDEFGSSVGGGMASSLSAYNALYPPSPVALYDDTVTTVDTSEDGTHTPLGTPRGNIKPFSARVGYFGGEHLSSSPVGTALGYTGTGLKPPGAAAAIQREKQRNNPATAPPVDLSIVRGSVEYLKWRSPQSEQGQAILRANGELAARAAKEAFYNLSHGLPASAEKEKTKQPRSTMRGGAAHGNTQGQGLNEKKELSFSFGSAKATNTASSPGDDASVASGVLRHRCFRSEFTEAQLMTILTTKMKPL